MDACIYCPKFFGDAQRAANFSGFSLRCWFQSFFSWGTDHTHSSYIPGGIKEHKKHVEVAYMFERFVGGLFLYEARCWVQLGNGSAFSTEQTLNTVSQRKGRIKHRCSKK